MKLGATSWNSVDVDGMYFRYNGNVGVGAEVTLIFLNYYVLPSYLHSFVSFVERVS